MPASPPRAEHLPTDDCWGTTVSVKDDPTGYSGWLGMRASDRKQVERDRLPVLAGVASWMSYSPGRPLHPEIALHCTVDKCQPFVFWSSLPSAVNARAVNGCLAGQVVVQ